MCHSPPCLPFSRQLIGGNTCSVLTSLQMGEAGSLDDMPNLGNCRSARVWLVDAERKFSCRVWRKFFVPLLN